MGDTYDADIMHGEETIMEINNDEFEILKREMIEDGYRQFAPTGANVDRDIIHEASCPDCKGPLIFMPFSKPNS